MAYGTDGFLGITKQGSWGTATTSWHFVPFVSEGLNTNIETIMPASILDRYDEPNPLEGLQTVEGDIVMELNPLDCRPLLACGLWKFNYNYNIERSSLYPRIQINTG